MSERETEDERMARLKIDDIDLCDGYSSCAGWAEAFTIFGKYQPNEKHAACAEHDEVLAGPDSEHVSDADLVRLAALGWHASTEGGFRKFT